MLLCNSTMSGIRLRDAPDVEGAIVGRLAPGETIEVDEIPIINQDAMILYWQVTGTAHFVAGGTLKYVQATGWDRVWLTKV